MEKVNKKYWIIGIVTTLIIAVTATTYAYWKGVISGSGEKMSMNFGQVYVLFTDNTSLTGEGEIKPGWNVSKTFTIENQGGKDFKYDIYIEDLINTFVIDGGLQYKITSDNNGYNMDDFEDVPRSSTPSDVMLIEGVIVGAKVKQTYTIEFKYNELGIDQSEDMNRNFSGVLAIKESNSKNLYSTLTNGSVYEMGERTDFSTPFGGETIQDGYNQTGKIYKADNDYYFAGNPSDNWVLFAGKYWRIIRSNSTEGTRLLYAGTSHSGQDGFINNQDYQWNSTYDNYTYVYWSNASFKSTLSNWYSNNITGTNDNMVEAIVYCNDTSYKDQSGWGTNGRSFGAYNRLVDAKSPSHSCGTNQFGSAAKVGMMTADEVAYAGGVYNNNVPNTYYYRNSLSSGCTGSSNDSCSVTANHHWWTLSPYSFNGTNVTVFIVSGSNGHPGYLTSDWVIGSSAVRPVITLKPTVKVTGEGTTENPYVPVSDGSKSKFEVKVSSNDESMGTVSPVSQEVSFGEDASVTLNPKSGYIYKSNTCGGVVENNVMTIKNITDNKECSVMFGEDNRLYTVLSNGVKYTVGTRNTAATSPIEGTSISQGYNSTGKIYKVNNDYYFAGNPSDNWVLFAGKYWRIIRSNSTEGTRLLYAGTGHDKQDGYINNTSYVWNSSYDSYTYVYWSNASFKSTLSSWYSSNITGNNDSMVNSIVYCNDTSYTDMSSSWGTNGRKFGAYTRLIDSKAPSHSCGTNQFGSAAKVGMMTADEVSYAGGVHGQNAPNTYYYRNSVSSGCTGINGDLCSATGDNWWWTMSPCYFNNGYANVFFVHGSNASDPGQLADRIVHYPSFVRPVITLKPEVKITGSGTDFDPYVPSLTN